MPSAPFCPPGGPNSSSTTRRTLDPKLDVVFKLLFSRNQDLLVSLLAAVLRPAVPISAVTIVNFALPKSAVDDKGGVLDVLSAEPSAQELALWTYQFEMAASRNEGHEKGVAEGHEKGVAEGRAEGEQALRLAVEGLCDVLGIEIDRPVASG